MQVVVDKAVGGEQAQLADLTPGSTVEVSRRRHTHAAGAGSGQDPSAAVVGSKQPAGVSRVLTRFVLRSWPAASLTAVCVVVGLMRGPVLCCVVLQVSQVVGRGFASLFNSYSGLPSSLEVSLADRPFLLEGCCCSTATLETFLCSWELSRTCLGVVG